MRRLAWMMVCGALAATASAGTSEVARSTIAAGGGMSQSVTFALSGTVGQWEAHASADSGSFSLTGGFWGPAGTVVCPADLSGDGVVDATDLATLIASWGLSGPSDFDSDGAVGASDLAAMIAAWGQCL